MQHYKDGFSDVRDGYKQILLNLLNKYGITSVLCAIKTAPPGNSLVNLPESMFGTTFEVIDGDEARDIVRIRGIIGDAGILEYLSELINEFAPKSGDTIDRVAWGRLATYLKSESERILTIGLKEYRDRADENDKFVVFPHGRYVKLPEN